MGLAGESVPGGVLLLDGAPDFSIDNKGIGRFTCTSEGLKFRFACTPHDILATSEMAKRAYAQWEAKGRRVRPIKGGG